MPTTPEVSGVKPEQPQHITDVDIDFFQVNVVEAEKVLKEMHRRYVQALADLKWARKRQKSTGFDKGDEPAVARLVAALIHLGGAPDIKYTNSRSIILP